MVKANLIEVFCSMQGEGPHVGEEMLFIRFQDCALSCRFCDTPASFVKHPAFRYETAAGSGDFAWRPNPVSPEDLTDLVDGYAVPVLSLTGGEPLQHAEFLYAWLPGLEGRYRILLETNGVLPAALRSIIERVDIVSMDMKLPSVTGMRAYWREHEEFLRIAREKEVYVKVVVSSETEAGELEHAIKLLEDIAPRAPFILQPVTPAGTVKRGIEENRLQELYEISKNRLGDVRVIPQVHPMLGIL